MSQNEPRKSRIKRKLFNKYRLVVLNEGTFEERFSFKLSRLNVFVFSSVFAILLSLLPIELRYNLIMTFARLYDENEKNRV